MYFKLVLTQTVAVPPVHFGPTLYESIRRLLCTAVEGHVELEHESFVIAVLDIKSMTPGKLMDFGDALFSVHYEALVQRHFPGEVVEGWVSRIIPPSSVSFRVGALTAHTYIAATNQSYRYDGDINGFVNALGTTALKEGSVCPIRITGSLIPGNTIKLSADVC